MTMKKLAIILIASLLLFTACASDAASGEARIITYYTNLCNNGELYTDHQSRLHFADFTTMSSAFICPHPNCTHEDEATCPSFGMSICPTIYGDNLYYFTFEVSQEEDGYVWNTYFYRANLDGTNRVKINELKGLQVMTYTKLLLIGDTFYFCPDGVGFDEYGSTTDRNASYLYSYNFKDNKFTEIAKLAEGYGIGAWLFGIYNCEIYFHISYAEEEYDYKLLEDIEYAKSVFTEYCVKYNVSDGSISKLDYTVDYLMSGYLITSDADGNMTLHAPDGSETAIPKLQDASIVNGYIFDRISKTAYEIETGKLFSLKTEDIMTEVTAYIDGGYILRDHNHDDGGYIYKMVSADKLIGDKKETPADDAAFEPEDKGFSNLSEALEFYYEGDWKPLNIDEEYELITGKEYDAFDSLSRAEHYEALKSYLKSLGYVTNSAFGNIGGLGGGGTQTDEYYIAHLNGTDIDSSLIITLQTNLEEPSSAYIKGVITNIETQETEEFSVIEESIGSVTAVYYVPEGWIASEYEIMCEILGESVGGVISKTGIDDYLEMINRDRTLNVLHCYTNPCKLKYQLNEMITSLATTEQQQTLRTNGENGLCDSIATCHNLYSCIKILGTPLEKFEVYLKYGDETTISQEDIDLVLNASVEEITKEFANEYAIVVGDKAYAPFWLALNDVSEYERVGITREAVRERLPLYQDLALLSGYILEEQRNAFTQNISEFLGEPFTIDWEDN